MTDQILQTTSNILMIRPANFGYNEETAESNAFQSKDKVLQSALGKEMAMAEFDALVGKLRKAGVNVIVIEDTQSPAKPDAVFPNNWITFHQDGTVVTYPMLSEKRRNERREDIIDHLVDDYFIGKKIELETYETDDIILEGTGSLILDRPNKLAYACLSPRTSVELLNRFCDLLGFEPVAFHSEDDDGVEIYHTNVMMALGETFVIICLETLKKEEERKMLLDHFSKTKKEVIEISIDQMMQFAGNMLQVRNNDGHSFLVMSESAFNSLTVLQIERIEQHASIIYSAIPTIETLGGGSVRCMMAEVFLPPLN